MFAISNNLCGMGNLAESNLESIDEEIYLDIFEKCIKKTLILFGASVRIDSSRNTLKTALNNYCHFIKKRLNDLNVERIDEFIEEENDTSIGNRWKQSLHSIVVDVVRILREDFENEFNSVNIQLIIYFYEILLVITIEMTFSICFKL